MDYLNDVRNVNAALEAHQRDWVSCSWEKGCRLSPFGLGQRVAVVGDGESMFCSTSAKVRRKKDRLRKGGDLEEI